MIRPTIKIHDLELNQVYEREMNDEEYAQWQIDKAKGDLEEQTLLQKQEILNRLGLTEAEVKILLQSS